MVSPAVRLLGFVLLLATMFAAAYAAGASLGPITMAHQGHGGGMHMSTGSGPVPGWPAAGPASRVPGLGR